MRILIFPQHIRKADNPYCRLLYRDMPRFGVRVDGFSVSRVFWGKYDIFHLHWPECYLNRSLPKALVGSIFVLFSTAWLRMRGTRILWTAHNLRSHARSHPLLEAWFWQVFTRMLDGFVSLSDSCAKCLQTDIPSLRQAKNAVIPHGHYREAYPEAVAKTRARHALDLKSQQTVLLFFGGVSSYKNVPHLIDTFRETSALSDAVMMIAGRPDSTNHARMVEQAAQGDARIRLDLRRVPQEQVQVLFSAADLVVLPFSDIMHSGSAILALSFNKPVLVPARGSLPELQSQVGSNWIRTYEGELTPQILTAATGWAKSSDRGLRPDLSTLEWPSIVQTTLELYTRLCSQSLPLKHSQASENLESTVILNHLPPA